MKRAGYKKAQSVLEYVIVLSAIVLALVGAVSLLGGTAGTTGLSKLFKQMQTKMEAKTGEIGGIVGGTTSGGGGGSASACTACMANAVTQCTGYPEEAACITNLQAGCSSVCPR